LVAAAVEDGVFHVVVGSPAVARFIVDVGPRHCARFRLGFHHGLPHARACAAELSVQAPPVMLSKHRRGRRPLPPWSRMPASSSGFGGRGLIPLPRARFGEGSAPQLPVASAVASSFKDNASAPLSPTSGAPRSAHAALEPRASANGAPGSPAAHPPAINAACSPLPRSYLDAARCPPLPSPKTPSAPFKNLSLDGCFRCLSVRHQVRSCRDPIRCRGCGRSGHRLKECTMPFPQPTFVPVRSSPRPANPSAAPRRPATPYPASLLTPLSPLFCARRARSSSPPVAWARSL
jgi:hypothetical protein